MKRSSFSTALVSSLVLQRLDYGDATLAGIISRLMNRMQSLMNSAARLVYSTSRYDRITLLLTQLHCLNVPERIEFKLAALAYRYLHRTALSYLAEEFQQSSLRPVNVSAPLRYHRLTPVAPVVQPSAIELFPSPRPACGTL